MRYWIRVNKETFGPYTPAEISRIPQVNKTTLVCPDGMEKDWRPISEFRELNVPPEVLGSDKNDARYCPKCHWRVHLKEKFCGKCGTEYIAEFFETESEAQSDEYSIEEDFKEYRTRKTGSTPITKWAAVAGVGLLCVVLFWKIFAGGAEPRGDGKGLSNTATGSLLEISVLDSFYQRSFVDAYGKVRKAREDHRWWFVELKALNLSTTFQRKFNRAWVHALDAKGAVYGSAPAGLAHPIPLSDATLNSNKFVVGFLLFEIPDGVMVVRLKYEAKGTDPIYIGLPEEKWPGREEDAVRFVRDFPVQCPMPDMPTSPVKLFDKSMWRAPKTIDEVVSFSGNRAYGKVVRESSVAEKKPPAKVQAEIDAAFAADSEAFLLAIDAQFSSPRWSAKGSGGPEYVVTVVDNSAAKAPTLVYEVNLKKKTLRPLNIDAWLRVDEKSAIVWGDTFREKTPGAKSPDFNAALAEEAGRVYEPVVPAKVKPPEKTLPRKPRLRWPPKKN